MILDSMGHWMAFKEGRGSAGRGEEGSQGGRTREGEHWKPSFPVKPQGVHRWPARCRELDNTVMAKVKDGSVKKQNRCLRSDTPNPNLFMFLISRNLIL